MKQGLVILISSSIFVVIVGVINLNTVRISEYFIEAPARSSVATSLKIVFAADFHIDKDNAPEHLISRFFAKTNSLSPDIVLFGGDIFDGNFKDLESKTSILKQINAKYGVFGILGNHDYYGNQRENICFLNAGIEFLCDTVIVIADKFCLAGRLDNLFNGRKTAEELLKTAIDTLPLITLDHSPTDIHNIINTKTDIQLSGHAHRGQLFPINLTVKKIYRLMLSYGYKKFKNTNVFVTSGLYVRRYPVRTVGKSEIMVINVKFIN